jgi:tRNA nucleotidyltransferase (CCA-adding enzyme)
MIKSLQEKNIKKLLERRLPASALRMIKRLGALADEYGISAYLVGGCVRDLLLGVKNLDLDIVVEAEAIDFAQFLQNKKKLQVISHRKFGTATLKLANGFKIDLASARREFYSSPAVLPRVSPSHIQQDLRRRDFTINTLAVKINRADFGLLLDPFQGRRDLTQKRIRILHDRSFIDDPTRILRAIRFEQRFEFAIEPHSFRLMRKAIAAGLLARLSRFRLGREFILFLKEQNMLKAVLRFDKLCGLRLIHPMVKIDSSILSPLKQIERRGDWRVIFALLTQPLDDSQFKGLCDDFSITRVDRKRLNICRAKKGAGR